MVRRCVTAALLLAVVATAEARVVASIDRALIDANESFTLSIAVDNMLSDEPDVTALNDDFDILGAQESNNTRIYNGQISQQRLFTFQLMPKREGVLEIPAIRVGQERSQPLSVTVRAADTTSAAGRDIFVEVSVDRPTTWVQAQVILSLRVYRAELVRQEQLREPTFEGPEVLVQQLGDDRSFSKQIGDRAYDVFERRYAIYPQASGTLDVGEFVYSGRIWQRSRLSSRRLFRSEPVTVAVLPMPAPPPAFPDAVWLPATDVELTQRWNPETQEFLAGEPVTRAVGLTATGLMANQLPPIEPAIDAGVRVYPDQPELETRQADQGLVGIRTERYAVIAARSGTYEVPAVQLPWWDVDEGRWSVAELPATELTVMPAVGDPADVSTGTVPPAVAGPVGAGPVGAATAPAGALRTWQIATAVAAALWLITVTAWVLSSRRPKRPQRPAEADPSRLGQRRRLLRDARAAAGRGDYDRTARLVREWADLEFGGGPWSLSDIATRLDGERADAVRALNQHLYGRPSTPPSTDALAAAIASLSRLPAAAPAARVRDGLAPLSPLGDPNAQ